MPSVARTLLFFQCWLLGNDFIRYGRGTLFVDPSHRQLFYAHLSLFLYWPLFGLLYRHAAQIRAGTFRSLEWYLTLGFVLFHVQGLTHAVLAYRDRGSLVIYFLLMTYFQTVFLWYQSTRIVSVVIAALVMGVSIAGKPYSPVHQLSNLSDLFLVTILIYWLSTMFFNARLRFFRERYELTLNVQESEEFVNELKTQHDQVVNKLGHRTRELTAYTLRELSLDAHDVARMEAKWRHFKLLFEEVHPEFWTRVAKTYPQLNAHDMRLAALLRMNLTTKEVAEVLGISPQSANTARYRLRKKMGLQPQQELGTAVQAL